jgi:acetolactate synthase-1/3 small subunit
MTQVLVALTDDEPGVLNRVTSLIRRRAFNIHSLTVGPTGTAGVSRMTLVVDAEEAGARRIQAHLQKLVNVLQVEHVTGAGALVRDLALIRVAAGAQDRAAVFQLAHAFRAAVVDVCDDSLVLEVTGSPSKIDALVDVVRPYGLLDMGRTGAVAMTRGAATRTETLTHRLTA